MNMSIKRNFDLENDARSSQPVPQHSSSQPSAEQGPFGAIWPDGIPELIPALGDDDMSLFPNFENTYHGPECVVIPQPHTGPPLSEHCAAVPHQRTCCLEHARDDYLLFKNVKYASEMRGLFGGVCSYKFCGYCAPIYEQILGDSDAEREDDNVDGSLPKDPRSDPESISPGFNPDIQTQGVTKYIADKVLGAPASHLIFGDLDDVSNTLKDIAHISMPEKMVVFLRKAKAIFDNPASLVQYAKENKMLTIAVLGLAAWGLSFAHHQIEAVLDSIKSFINFASLIGTSFINNLSDILAAIRRAVSTRQQTQSVETNEVNKDVEPQSVTGFSACAATALLLCVPQKENTDWYTLAKGALLKASALSTGIAVATNGFLYLCNYLPDMIKDFLCDYVSPTLFNDSLSDDHLELMLSLNAVNTKFFTEGEKIFSGTDLASRAINMYKRLEEEVLPIILTLPKGHMIGFLYNKVTHAAQKYMESGARIQDGATRPEPWGVYIVGAPGIGKTFLISSLCSQLFGTCDEMYQRNISDAYWSGYYGQKFTYIDDFLAANTPKAAEDNSQILSLISSSPVPLNMAALEDKGTFFNSQVFAVTSNTEPHPTIPGVTCAEAFQRRFDIVQATVVPEFAVDPQVPVGKRKVNFRKLNQLPDNEKSLFPHLLFRTFSLSPDSRIQWGKGITYSELLALGKAKIKHNYEDYLLRKELIRRAANNYARGMIKPQKSDLLAPDNLDLKVDIEVQADDEKKHDIAEAVETNIKSHNLDVIDANVAQQIRDMAAHVCSKAQFTKDEIGQIASRLNSLYSSITEKCVLRTDTARSCITRNMRYLLKHPYEVATTKIHFTFEKLNAWRQYLLTTYRDEKFETPINLKYLGAVLGVATAAYATVQLFKDLTSVPEAQSIKTERAQKTTTIRRTRVKRNEKRGHRVKRVQRYGHDDRHVDTIITRGGIIHREAQAEEEEDFYLTALDDKYEERKKNEDILRKVFNNLISISIEGCRLDGIIYNGSRFVTCRHIFFPGGNMVEEGTEMKITIVPSDSSAGATTHSIPFRQSSLYSMPNEDGTESDLVVYAPDSISFPTKPKINRFFALEASLSKINSEDDAYIMRRFAAPNQRMTRLESGVEFNQERMAWPIAKNGNNPDITVTESLKYDAQSHGDCGSPIILNTPQPGKVLGIHAASDVRRGYGIGMIITRETLDEFDELLDASGDIVIQCSNIFPARICPTSDERIPPNSEPTGTVVGKGTSLSKKTNLTPSIIAKAPAIAAIDYEPALLGSPTDIRCKGMGPDDILFKNLNKQFSKEKKLFPQKLVDRALADVISVVQKQDPAGPKRELTLNEALNKAEAYPHLGRLDYSTSEGFPWCKKRPHTHSSKRYLFNIPEDDTVDEKTNPITVADEDLKAKLEEDWDDLAQGIAPNWIWKMANKDETRSRAKIDAQATRSVACSPVDATISSKRTMGAFVNMFHAAHSSPTFFSAVGMNVHSSDWDDLIRRFKAVSPVGFDGDFSDFESLLTPQMAAAVFAVIDAWYDQDEDPKARIRRRTVFYNYIHSIRLVGRTAFKVHSQNPSGNWLTTIINTILLALLARIGFLGVAAKHDPSCASLLIYANRVAEIFYGDDNAFAVKDMPWFNCETLREFFSQFGINYTSADKDDASIGKLKPVEDIEFLKQQTHVPKQAPIPTVKYYPRTTEKSLLKSLKYVSKKLDVIEATQINANDCLCRAWGSGRKRFESIRMMLEAAFLEAGYSPRLYTYEYIQQLWERKHIDFNPNGEHQAEIMRAPDRIFKPKKPQKFQRSFKYEDVTAPFTWNIHPQAGEDAVVTEATLTTATETAEVAVLSPDDDTSAAVPDKDLPIHPTSIRDLVKRPFTAWKPNGTGDYEFTWFPAEAMRTTPSSFHPELLRGGFLAWYSGMYAVWRGGFIIRFFGSENLNVCYDSWSIGDLPSIAQQQYMQTNNLAQLSGLAPQAVGTVDSGALEVKCPFVTNRHVLAVPKRNYHIGNAYYCSGSLNVHVADTYTSPETVALISAADDFRLAYLHTVPWVKVTGDRFTHAATDALDVPELILVNHSVSATDFFMDQRRVLEVLPAVPNLTNATPVTTMTIDSASLSVGELRALGYNLADGQSVNILVGVTSPPVEFDLSAYYAMSDDLSMDFSLSSTVSANGWTTIPQSASFTWVDENDPLHPRYTAADVWAPTLDNYMNPAFKQAAGIPTVTGNEVAIVTNTTIPLNITVNPGSAIEHLGVTYYDFNPHHHDVTTSAPALNKSIEVQCFNPDIVCQMETTMEEVKGVTVADVEHASTSGGRPIVSTDSAGVMSENQLNFNDLAERWNNTTSLDWTSTTQVGTVLYSANLPWDALTTETNKAAFERFVYSRAGVRVTFGLQSNAFQAGKVIAFFVPLLDKDHAARTFVGHFPAMTANPHVFLNAGASGRTTLDIPFVHPNRFLDAALSSRAAPDITSLGSLHIVVFNHLRVGDATPVNQARAKINVMYSFTDSEFKVIDPLKVSSLPTLNKDIVPQGSVTSKVTNINIENVADSTIDAANTKDALEAKNKTDVTSGMDRPNIGLNHAQFVKKPRPNISNFANVDQVTVLAGRAGGTAELRPNDVATTQDEMSLSYVCGKPTFYRKIQLGIADNQGTKLASWKLVPNPIMAFGAKNEILTPTLAGFAVQPFAFWHGDLEYTFEFVGSGFHTARIAFCAHYGRDAETIPFEEAMAQYATVVDFNGANQRTKVSVPYKAATDFLRVPPGDMGVNWNEASMGEFSVWVITGLQAPETVSQSITMNVYFSISNLTLKYPSANNIDFWPGYDITDLENTIPDTFYPQATLEHKDGSKTPVIRAAKNHKKQHKQHTKILKKKSSVAPPPSPTGSDTSSSSVTDDHKTDSTSLSYTQLPQLPSSVRKWVKL